MGAVLERFRAVPGLPRRDPEAYLHHERDESLNARFRQAVRRRGHFPTKQAALKILYLTVRERRPNRANPTGRVNNWKAVLNVLASTYGDRLNINQPVTRTQSS